MTHPYATDAYAQTLFHIGRPVAVPEWGCNVVARPIPGGGEDLAGCYPIAVLNADADLRGGLARLRAEGFVSVTLTLDDFHRPSIEELQNTFDVVRPFKTHFVHQGPIENYRPGRNHRHKINRSRRSVITKPIDLSQYVAAWASLYHDVINKHSLSGMHAFTLASFEMLAQIPGLETIGGFVGNELVSCNTWVTHNGRVHSHLVASNALGYELRAAYAVSDASVTYFRNAEIVNFGGGAGVEDNAEDGLAQFKRGFGNAQARSYICGAILDRSNYARLTTARNRLLPTDYFPAYRAPTELAGTAS